LPQEDEVSWVTYFRRLLASEPIKLALSVGP
jgi:hypothetical protein